MTNLEGRALGLISSRYGIQCSDLRAIGHAGSRVHEVSRSYAPPSERYARPHWYETDEIAVKKYVPATETGVLRSSMKVLEALRQLPTSPQSYGMIHADLHRGNFFVKDGVFTVFDFGICQYCWYTYDVAVCLYHALFSTPKDKGVKESGEHFLGQFMRGYQESRSTCEIWLDEIPLFLKLRRIVMYVDMLRYWDLAQMSPERAVSGAPSQRYWSRHPRAIGSVFRC
jgi:Ser/Thr protein kinase RdoA (MazF antagonist)